MISNAEEICLYLNVKIANEWHILVMRVEHRFPKFAPRLQGHFEAGKLSPTRT